MKIDLNKASNGLLKIVAILAVFGISWTGITGKLKLVWQIDNIVETQAHQDSLIVKQAKQIHALQIQNRMSYETDRVLTDLLDSTIYEITPSDGIPREVTIRGTNEGFRIAFISDMWIQYPLYKDRDGRDYITLHDDQTHEREGTYIYKKK